MSRFRVVLPLLVVSAVVGCRPPEDKATSALNVPDNTGFIRRPLSETERMMALAPSAPAGIMTPAGDHRFIARVVYTGKRRIVPPEDRAALTAAEKRTGTVPLADDIKNELLFQEKGRDYWMPVGAQTEPEFLTLKAGEPIDVYASFVAAVKKADGQVDYIFVAQEYMLPADVQRRPTPASPGG